LHGAFKDLFRRENLMTDDTAERLLAGIQQLESRAHILGLTITARSLNNAKNTCGWELAGNTDRADKSTRGER
jgi:hypothetical protein